MDSPGYKMIIVQNKKIDTPFPKFRVGQSVLISHTQEIGHIVDMCREYDEFMYFIDAFNNKYDKNDPNPEIFRLYYSEKCLISINLNQPNSVRALCRSLFKTHTANVFCIYIASENRGWMKKLLHKARELILTDCEKGLPSKEFKDFANKYVNDCQFEFPPAFWHFYDKKEEQI
jgi:hypothetical protein